jgi:hypothetical protein
MWRCSAKSLPVTAFAFCRRRRIEKGRHRKNAEADMAAPVGGHGAANPIPHVTENTTMRPLSYFCFVSAALYALVGMAMGIFMAASHDHTLSPAHAHLNLLGWVSMGIFGLYYQAAPAAGDRKIAKVHVAFATLSVWLLIPGVAMATLGMNEALAVIGSLATIASMALFFFIVVTARPASKASAA